MALTDEQLAERKQGIGGSDAPAVVGLDAYRTPLDVYLDKISAPGTDDLDGNIRIALGNELEDAVARIYAKRNGVRVMRRGKITSKKHPFMLANVDRWIVGKKSVLEVKTTSIKRALVEPLEAHVVQVLHYLAVTGAKSGVIVYLVFGFGGPELREYVVEHHEPSINGLIELEAEFWSHVEKRVPPPPSNPADIAKLYSHEDSGKVITATPDIEALCLDIKAKAREEKQARTSLDDARDMLRMAMLDATLLVDGSGKPLATWNYNKSSEVTNWKGVAADLAGIVGDDQYMDIVKSHTTVKPGHRVLRVK